MMISRSKTVSVAIGAFFLLGLGVSTVRADSVHARQFRELSRGQQIKLELLDLSQQEAVGYLQNEHPNNGRHLGFSMSSMRHGPTLGVVGYNNRLAATQNPEPATMVLFGTGLIALGAYGRRRHHG